MRVLICILVFLTILQLTLSMPIQQKREKGLSLVESKKHAGKVDHYDHKRRLKSSFNINRVLI